MVSSPNATPTGFFTAGRMKWLWLVVAGAIGLWLVILLAVSGGDEPSSPPGATPKGEGVPKQYERAGVFSKRPELRSSRPSSAPVPLRVDQGQGK